MVKAEWNGLVRTLSPRGYHLINAPSIEGAFYIKALNQTGTRHPQWSRSVEYFFPFLDGKNFDQALPQPDEFGQNLFPKLIRRLEILYQLVG